MHSKMMDLVVQNPAGPLFDPIAQIIVATGLVLFLVMWGISKMIKARK